MTCSNREAKDFVKPVPEGEELNTFAGLELLLVFMFILFYLNVFLASKGYLAYIRARTFVPKIAPVPFLTR